MKDSARHSLIMLGVALLISAGIMFYMSFGPPVEYVTPDSSTVPHGEYNDFVTPEIEGVVNINTATVDELTRIDGIGESIAEQIVGYREAYGDFSSVDELMNIKGVGESKFSQIAPHLTV